MKELSFAILMIAFAIVVAVFAISFAIAVINSEPGDIQITGDFNIGKFEAIILGIAFTATILVSQQLTKKDNTTLMTFLERNFGKQADSGNGNLPTTPTEPESPTITPEAKVKDSMQNSDDLKTMTTTTDLKSGETVTRVSEGPDLTKLHSSEPTRILDGDDKDNG